MNTKSNQSVARARQAAVAANRAVASMVAVATVRNPERHLRRWTAERRALMARGGK